MNRKTVGKDDLTKLLFVAMCFEALPTCLVGMRNVNAKPEIVDITHATFRRPAYNSVTFTPAFAALYVPELTGVATSRIMRHLKEEAARGELVNGGRFKQGWAGKCSQVEAISYGWQNLAPVAVTYRTLLRMGLKHMCNPAAHYTAPDLFRVFRQELEVWLNDVLYHRQISAKAIRAEWTETLLIELAYNQLKIGWSDCIHGLVPLDESRRRVNCPYPTSLRSMAGTIWRDEVKYRQRFEQGGGNLIAVSEGRYELATEDEANRAHNHVRLALTTMGLEAGQQLGHPPMWNQLTINRFLAAYWSIAK